MPMHLHPECPGNRLQARLAGHVSIDRVATLVVPKTEAAGYQHGWSDSVRSGGIVCTVILKSFSVRLLVWQCTACWNGSGSRPSRLA